MRRSILTGLIVVSSIMLLGVVVLAVLKVSLSTKESDVNTNFACGGNSGLHCPENYICVQNNAGSLTDTNGTCIFDD